MRLNSFFLSIDGIVIHDLPFQDGLNLITNDPENRFSGNSVGKSTFSRVFDYLMIGSIEPIYIDPEYGTANQTIKTLFESKTVIAKLNYTDQNNEIKTISRNLTTNTDAELFFVNDEPVSKQDYEIIILKSIYNISSKRPSLRFVSPKFNRNDSHKMLHTVHFLDKFSSDSDYTELFLYLFGFDDTSLLTQHREATTLLKKKKKHKTNLNSIIKEDKTTTTISQTKKNIKNLEAKLNAIEVSSLKDDPVQSLIELQNEDDEISRLLFKYQLKIKNIQDTIEEINQAPEAILAEKLRAIYQYAKLSVEGPINDWEESLEFHGNLILQKRKYLESALPEILNEKQSLESKRININNEKENIFSKAITKEKIEEIGENIKAIAQLKNDLVKLEGLIERRDKATKDEKDAEKELSKLVESINNSLENFESFKEAFNKNLNSISKKIHKNDQHNFFIEFDSETGNCKIKFDNPNPNPEGGKKKAEIIGFDLSYIKTVSASKLKRPNFIIIDSIEDIDINQIQTIFEISNQLKGQVIVSMLSDKFSKKQYMELKNNIIILLSEKEKFFKQP